MNPVKEWLEKVFVNYLSTLDPDQITHIQDWLVSDDAKAHYNHLPSYSISRVQNLADQWINSLAKQNIKENEGDTEKILECDNGFFWVKLLTPNALIREGTLMKHCVGSYIHRGYSQIYSLRDKNNRPHCTMEVYQENLINQIQGKANSPLAERYTHYLQAFLSYMHQNSKVLLDNNNVYTRHNLYYINKEIVKLSEVNTIKGSLTLTDYAGVLAENLIVEGNLTLNRFTGTMPKHLMVEGSLKIIKSTPKVISEIAIVKKNLEINKHDFSVPSTWQFQELKEIRGQYFPDLDLDYPAGGEPMIFFDNFRTLFVTEQAISRIHRAPQAQASIFHCSFDESFQDFYLRRKNESSQAKFKEGFKPAFLSYNHLDNKWEPPSLISIQETFTTPTANFICQITSKPWVPKLDKLKECLNHFFSIKSPLEIKKELPFLRKHSYKSNLNYKNL